MAARVYVLRFAGTSELSRAFDRILSSPDVDSCVIDSDQVRVRFFAPEDPAEKLVERIYQEGGLVWCSRHRLESLPSGS